MRRRRTIVTTLLAASMATVVAAAALADTSVKDYVVPVGDEYEVDALFSVGDQVPWSGGNGQYRMVGIPDGLGAHPNADVTATVYMNSELPASTLSEPLVGGAKNRGAIVSKWILDADGDVLAGTRAYDVVFDENTFVGPAPVVGNSTRPFSRFCSGSLAGPPHGFDRWIYLTNEEEGTPANTFDGKGGLAVAIVDDALHTLPKLGRFAWENTLVQPNQGTRTVIMGMEDGPAAFDPGVENSQLYMYVGTKDRSAGAGVLRRNGLDNGDLYVLVPANTATSSEATFTSGSIAVEWALIPNAGELDEGQLEAASDALGAFRFARPEDGAFNTRNKDNYLFVTTGGATGVNELGRLYSLDLHPGDVTKNATLTIEYAGDSVVDEGGDTAISPDNLDVNDDYLMINEDGTTESRVVMTAKNRDGSIWRFDLERSGVDVSSRARVAELDPPGRDGAAVGPGIWETSGIVDVSAIFGPDTWLADVQAHPPTAAPGGTTVTVEDGQLFLLTPTP
ncbi:MAG: alkaline phosphatase PhoX [Gaiellaceae bacterium]